MGLRKTLKTAHECLESENIDHALIGGLALATLGINRATIDVDFLIDESDKEKLKHVLLLNGFVLELETEEVLHFKGIGRKLKNMQTYLGNGKKSIK